MSEGSELTEGKDAWAAAVSFCIDTQGKGDSLAESWVPYRIIDTVAQEPASALQPLLDFHLCQLICNHFCEYCNSMPRAR